MDKKELESMLISLFPAFEEHWKQEDIDKEDDGSFTAHGIMSSFTHFYRENYANLDTDVLKKFCCVIEEVVAEDPNDKSEVANAICTGFLELIAGDAEGKKLDPFLGKACKEFYSHWL